MHNNQQGYILFLLFSILSVCSIIISLCFSRTIVYKQIMHITNQQQQCQQLAFSSISLAESLLVVEEEKKGKEKQSSFKNLPETNTEEPNKEQKLLTNIFSYFRTEKKLKLTQAIDHFDATITLNIQPEDGKLNLNALYDFTKKKFLNEGKTHDCKKLCVWLFNRISEITGKPSLMSAFQNLLEKRKTEFNDPLELLSDKDFKEQFSDAIFINFEDKNKKLFLTDIFTVYTNVELDPIKIINPWLFSNSWLTLLGIHIKENITKEEIKKTLKNFKTNANWQEDWNICFKNFYQKEYKDLPEEIKSILTTTFEVNIFSLLVKAKIGETVSSMFTIVKANTKQHLTGFDILKTSQI